ncbi:MAG: MogA/MoaB family molybdenum cofactor biosynthesis protein, partial [Desulfovibrio sp.]|nr:MogA/MoaB family molybdenum cofactor biosynthesis protein [Desulfovibrio sp.]
MELVCTPCACGADEELALLPGDLPGAQPGARAGAHRLGPGFVAAAQQLGAGWTLAATGEPGTAIFLVTGRAWRPDAGGTARSCPVLRALRPVAGGAPQCFTARKKGFAAAWITLSDKGAQGARTDEAGPLVGELLASALPLALCRGYLLPDEPGELRALLSDLALHQGFDLVCTTGGTGLSPRDQT